jgi:glycosyltransferase involved in cell wall biosynthesis
MFFSNAYNEARAARHSDVLIAINERDKTIIEKMYKRRVDHIHTVWLEDYPLPPEEEAPVVESPLEVLFVGSWFYANVAGITWFIKKVLPKTAIHLTVAGNKMEKLRVNQSGKLSVIGTVDNLDELYSACDCVVAPIFHGSGMKVKVAEAFRHGKTVVGTPESFTGYRVTDKKEGYICRTADEFAGAFEEIAGSRRKKINTAAAAYFRNYLSKTYAVNNFSNIVNDICRGLPAKVS